MQIPFNFDSDGRALVPLAGWPAGLLAHFQVMDLELDFAAGTVRSSFSAGYSTTAKPPGGPAFPGTLFAGGLASNDVAMGDVNSDGFVDLIAADGFGGGFAVLLGDGLGSFENSLPQGGVSVADSQRAELADMNNDGLLDAVLLRDVSFSGGELVVVPGNGDSTFGFAVATSLGSKGDAQRIADFDSDGALDVAIALQGGGLFIAKGKGDGTFEPGVTYPAGSSSRGIAVGDIDGDGLLDCATAEFGPAGQIHTFLGQAGATFVPGPVLSGIDNVRALALGDFDGDGVADLALTRGDFGAAFLETRLGSGSGTFGAPQVFPVEGLPDDLEAVDLDADGRLDLVVSSYVTFFYGLGDGGFEAPVSYATRVVTNRVAVGDVDSDGRPDVAWTLIGDVGVIPNRGGREFGGVEFMEDPINPARIVFADLDGDGLDDLVMTEPGGTVRVRLRLPLGGLAPEQTFAAGAEARAVTVADFNGDGDLDLAVGNVSTVSILLGSGTGSLQLAGSYPVGGQPIDLGSADFDGDGSLDLAVAHPGRVEILAGAGDGSFGTGSELTVGFINDLELADFDLDGRTDIAVAGSSSVRVLLNLGTGSFSAPQNYAADPFSDPVSLAIGDLDQDGAIDLVVARDSGDPLAIALGLGDGSFALATTIATETDFDNGTPPVEVLDLDADGILDVLLGNRFLKGLGGGALGWPNPAPYYDTHPELKIAGFGDIDGDGLADLVGWGDIGFSNFHLLQLVNQILK